MGSNGFSKWLTPTIAVALAASTVMSCTQKKERALDSKIQELEISLNSSLQNCASHYQALRKALAESKSEKLEQKWDSKATFTVTSYLEKLWKPSSRSKFKAKVRVPRLKGGRMGVFSTRSLHRLCPIGLTVAKVEAARGHVVLLSGVDWVDGTADNMLAVSSVSFSEGFSSSLADCWETAKKKSLYASADKFECLIKQVLSWDIRSVSQRNQPHDHLVKTGNGETPCNTQDSDYKQVEEASDYDNDGVPLSAGDVIYHLILEGIDVSYRIDCNSNVIVEKFIASEILNSYQNHRDYLMWRDELS